MESLSDKEAQEIAEAHSRRKILTVALMGGLAAWNIILRRQLAAARMRGDMYRDISARLDRQLTGQTAKD